MLKESNCSVYRHRRADNNAIFYVGKASNKYRKDSKADRNTHWHQIVKEANGFISEIVVDDISEELSLLVEREYIDQLKRLNVALCNLTSGGQGKTGWQPSEETKKIWSEQRKGKAPWNKGTKKPYIKLSEDKLKDIRKEANKKISKALKGRIPWNKGIKLPYASKLIGITPWNKGKRVVGSRRWLKEQKLKETKE
jgi:hypothetical protein